MRPPERHELDPIEIASRDEIAALQLQRLRWTLRHAYDHVAHYRSAFDRAGVRPDDLRTLADLARFPSTSKEDLRHLYAVCAESNLASRNAMELEHRLGRRTDQLDALVRERAAR